MRKLLIVVDMQNDFIDGCLGSKEAVAIVDKVAGKIKGFKGLVLYTRDTHTKDYKKTQEGKKLPVPHCIKGTDGWQISAKLPAPEKYCVVDKPSFGSPALARKVLKLNKEEKISEITLVGVCTDICVISNALILKAALPEVPVKVDASCCAGTSPENHDNAIKAMKCCQVDIENY